MSSMLDRAAWLVLFCLLAGCAGRDSESPDRETSDVEGADPSREQMDAWWKLYQRADEKWPDARDRWARGGSEASAVLVMSLVRDLVQKAPQRLADGSPAFRVPQRELLALDEESVVPVLIEAIRVGKEPNSLQAIADTLVEFVATDAVAQALETRREGDSPHSTPVFFRTLVRIGGERAYRTIDAHLTTGAEWQIRSHAAESLRFARASDHARASAVLARALDDSDPFVVRTALDSLSRVGRGEVAPRVAKTLAEAAARNDGDTAKAAVAALRAITGQRVDGDDPRRWADVAEQAAARANTPRP